MVEPGDEFDEHADDEDSLPLLPPEDRLWRHPSELALHGRDASPEAVAARARWLSSTPTRAGAWSAGIVGAVLATGVVLLGTHLTNWMYTPHKAGQARLVAVTTSPSMFENRMNVVANSVGYAVAAGLTVVQATTANDSKIGDGVVIRSDGMILVPRSVVAGATDIQVTTNDNQEFGATVVGVDNATGLALLHAAKAEGLTPSKLSKRAFPSIDSWTAFEWAGQASDIVSFASVLQASAGTHLMNEPGLLMSVVATTSGLPADPVGAVMIDGDSAITGIVAEREGTRFVEVPANVIAKVGAELIAFGAVQRGWLGITGATAGEPGVMVTKVAPLSAAARAGLKPGDVIVAINGERVTNMAEIQSVLYFDRPQQTIDVVVLRGHTKWACRPRLAAAA